MTRPCAMPWILQTTQTLSPDGAGARLRDGAVAQALQRAHGQQRRVLRHAVHQAAHAGGDVRAVAVAVVARRAALQRREHLARARARRAVRVAELLVAGQDALRAA